MLLKNHQDKPFKYIPKDKRKKILLICDDIRVHSGIGTVAKEIVSRTAQHFNWVQIAGAINHPDKGQRLDLSAANNTILGIEDCSIFQYPVDGYGDPELLRGVIDFEKPDAIMIFTDPRYFSWLFQMENEIRKKIPIIYLNIWDDLPVPLYNIPFYESCDLLMGISKQTVNINKIALKGREKGRMFKYLPHGLDSDIYKPLDENDPLILDFKQQLFRGRQADFVMFFNSRNMRRKQIPDIILAYRNFLDTIEKHKKGSSEGVHLVLHTEVVTDAGTDLLKVKEALLGEKYRKNLLFSTNKLKQEHLNCLYNIADVQLLITSNEGWGLTLTEAMLSGTPFISNVTGGMQDQMRFEYDMNEGPGVVKGEWIDFDEDFLSNHFGTYRKHGKWAFPIFPSNISLQGSPQTPYIFDDRCDFRDITDQMLKVYKLKMDNPKYLKLLGLAGRKWAMSEEAGFTSKHQAKSFISYVDELFSTWKGKEKYELINANDYKGRIIEHSLTY